MPTGINAVNHFYNVTLKGSAGIDELSQLFTEDAIFRGPLQEGNGRDEITAINAAFVPFVKRYNRFAEFESGNDVSIIHEIHAQFPNGEKVAITLSEWFQLRDGLIATHRVYFDPRSFLKITSKMEA